MDSLAPTPRHDQPLHVIEDTYQRAFAALNDPKAPQLDGVVWLCVHLAAVQQVVAREVDRFVDRPAEVAYRRHTVQLERTLRTLEQLGSGDGLVSRVDADRVLHSLVIQMQAQAEREHRLLDLLAKRLSPDEQRRLAADYQRALTRAPTRPHPHSPHGRRLGRLAFRVNGFRDRFMDTLDSRPTPTPHRPRKPIKSTRWGDYILGVSHTDARDDRR